MSDLGTHTGCGGQIRKTGNHDLWPYFCDKCGFQFASYAHAEDAKEQYEHLVWRIDEYSGLSYASCVPAEEASKYEKFKL